MCRNIRNKYISLHGHTKHVIQTNPSKFDERLFSGIHFRGWWCGGRGGERERENYNVKL